MRGRGCSAPANARMPTEAREQVEALDAGAMAGEVSEEDGLERLRLCWPAYFAGCDAGQFPWVERPGCVRAGPDRLAAG